MGVCGVNEWYRCICNGNEKNLVCIFLRKMFFVID